MNKMKPNNNDASLIPTQKHNSNITIQHLTQEFTQLQRENSGLESSHTGLVKGLFLSKEERLHNQNQIAKIEAYHRHEMRIGSAICEAKEQELQMQIASALSQKRIIFDAQTKERITKVYQEFSDTMNDRLKNSVQMYLQSIKEAELVPNEVAKQQVINYAEQKFKKDFKLIEDLVDDLLQKFYTDL